RHPFHIHFDPPERHPSYDLCALGLALRGVERPLLARDPLHQHPRILVHQDAHDAVASTFLRFFPLSATIFCAASHRSVAASILSPDSCSSLRPSSALVPCSRTTTGILIATSLAA